MKRLLAILLLTGTASTTHAQLLSEEPAGASPRYGEPVVGLFQVGAEVSAPRGAVKNIKAMVAVPLECGEQRVRIVEEDFSGAVDKVVYRDVPGGEARQMLISIPYLAPGAVAKAVVTFEVTTRKILPPSDDDADRWLVPRKPPRDLRRFVANSPYIEANHRKIRSLARSLLEEAGEDESDWQRVERLYDYVLDNISYIEGPDTSALTTLGDGSADCHGRSALFVALCRSARIPARIVWVNQHCFAEFYLEDADRQGRWFPAESAGSRAFGEMPLGRVVLQKGDNFRIPERSKDRLRYATDFLYVPPGNGKPNVKFIREAP